MSDYGRCITWCPVGIDLTSEGVGVAEEVDLNPNTDANISMIAVA